MTDAIPAPFDRFGLDGKVALITGGSRGMGKEIALAFARAGADVVVASRKTENCEKVAAEIQETTGRRALAYACHMGHWDEIEGLVDATYATFGRIDILVNNAGATWGAPAEDHPLEAWDKVMNLNARSLFLFSQAVARTSMIPRKSGRIVNIASVAGLGGNPPQMTTIAYNTSKGAAVNFTRALAAEWGKYGITVNALAPGFFPSKMTKGILETWGVDNAARMAPLQRLGDDEDLKGAVALFASAAGKHVTGQVLAIDGGASCVIGG